MPLQAELLPAAAIFLRYLGHFDAAKVDLIGPDPNVRRLARLNARQVAGGIHVRRAWQVAQGPTEVFLEVGK